MSSKSLNERIKRYNLELVIGLETHVRLNTKTKLFCSCVNQENEIPNQNICSVCTGQMGVLPAINKQAIIKAIIFGKVAKSSFKNKIISWDRKHYEYPDNPKNIQISQFYNPIIPDGQINCYRSDGSIFTVDLAEAHLEEDAAKLFHQKKWSLVDFNKAGVPLIEIVSKPCIKKIEDAAIYAQYLQRIVQYLEISDANLEKGEFKSDISVSLKKKGSKKLNPRTEIKNLNSFKFITLALLEEVEKQLDFFIKNGDFSKNQKTVLWDENLNTTRTMRAKEYEADYRFITEPDLPFVNISQNVKSINLKDFTLPFEIESVLIKGGVSPQEAKYFTQDKTRARIFTNINQKIKDTIFVTKALFNHLKPQDYKKITNIKDFIKIFDLLKQKKITNSLVKNAIVKLLKNPSFDYLEYFNKNMISMEKLKSSIKKIVSDNSKIVEQIETGDLTKIGALVGKVLVMVGDGASGKLVRQKIEEFLSENSKVKIKSSISKDDFQKIKKQINNIPIVVKDIYKTHSIKQITENFVSKSVLISGWVVSIRDHGDLIFIDIRDSFNELFQIRFSRDSFEDFNSLTKLKPESVISVKGVVIKRDVLDYNQNLRLGKIELNAKKLDILNLSSTLPFEIKKAEKINENIRFQYKFLDHRNSEVHQVLVNRHKVLKIIRDILDKQGFLEIETPILTAGTDEGAREYIVPTRKKGGYFYTLPQAPQQFKQMLMVGGVEKYFQIARCFRDEDTRGDRQPEFTQLDMEMSFTNIKQIIKINSDLFKKIVTKIYGDKWILNPFEIMTYKDSMDMYGTDRPDLRFGLKMSDITQIVKKTSFKVFSKPIQKGGVVKCIKLTVKEQGGKRVSKGQIEKLTKIAQKNGLGGLAYIMVNKDELQSPIIKFLGFDITEEIIKKVDAKVGDIVFFSAAVSSVANKALDAVRRQMGKMFNLINPRDLNPVWIINFPMFELAENGKWTFTHNPFSMPQIGDIKNHLDGVNIGSIIAQQYDFVLNGYEVGGGSIRAHKAEILQATFRNMGYSKEKMIKSIGPLFNAFSFGAPPHGGIAWGVDRLMMILENKNSIRDVIAFPKTGSGEDLLFGSPSVLSKKKVKEMNVKVLNNLQKDKES